jgi:hypothetical protein
MSGRSATWGEMVPDRKLLFRSSWTKLRRLNKELGMVELSWLKSRSSTMRLSKLVPISGGIGPDKSPRSRNRNLISDNAPNSDGIVPTRLFLSFSCCK